MSKPARQARSALERSDAREKRRLAQHNARTLMEAGAAIARESARRPEPSTRVDGRALDSTVYSFAKMIGRPVSVFGITDVDSQPNIVQRCRACRAEIVSRITDTLRDSKDWMAQLGALIRYDYDSHLCAPIAPQLHAYTIEQLDEMMQGAEREGERCFKRYEEIRKALDRALDARERGKE